MTSPEGEDHVPVDDHLPRDNGFLQRAGISFIFHEPVSRPEDVAQSRSRSCWKLRTAVASKDQYRKFHHGSARCVCHLGKHQVQEFLSRLSAALPPSDVDTALVPHFGLRAAGLPMAPRRFFIVTNRPLSLSIKFIQ